MSNPDILYKGIPRGRTRGYTSDSIESLKPKKVVIPCAGSFSLASVSVKSGLNASCVEAGDISLYSTVLGYAIQNKGLHLSVIGNTEEAECVSGLMTDPISKAVAVLFVLRVLQYKNRIHIAHKRDFYNELIVNKEVYFKQLKEQVELKVNELSGMSYLAEDIWKTIEGNKDDPESLLLVNPPRYSGGYDRMFSGVDDVFQWEKPPERQFTEDDYAELMRILGESAATSFIYYATPDMNENPALQWGEPWRAVFADLPQSRATASINWIVANREPVKPAISRSVWQGEGKFKLFDGEITNKTELVAQKIERKVGLYYRDLFVHKQPNASSEMYVGLMLDGELLATIGIHVAVLSGAHRKKEEYRCPSITFAFTVPHETYGRLGKLTLMSITSSWFWQQTMGDIIDLHGGVNKVMTTMLTPHPENKTSRGIMKLTNREKVDGGYKLRYTGEIKKRTQAETVAEFLERFGDK